MIILYGIGLVIAFVAGVLVGRKNKATVDTVVTTVATDVKKVEDVIKKV